MAGPEMELFRSLVVLVNDTTIGSRELDSMAHNRAEHSLEVESRTDRLTDLTQCPQLVDGLRKVTGSCFEFLEQANVLNGDYRLIGKGFQKRDLLLGERSHLDSPNQNNTQRNPLTEQRCRKHGSISESLLKV